MSPQKTHTAGAEPNLSQAAIENVLRGVAGYEWGRPATALTAVEALVNASNGNREARQTIELALCRLLTSAATAAAKQFACKQLSIIGTAASVPVLGKMLESPDRILVESACIALSGQASPPARRTACAALNKAQRSGKALAALITLVSELREPAGVPKLVELANAPDALASDTAIAALGRIASPEAVRSLSELHKGKDEKRRILAAHALLESAEQITRHGDSKAAAQVYRTLSAGSEPPQIRRGALLASPKHE